jgi:PhoH-like ATPase
MTKLYLIDTNTLLDHPRIIEEYKCVILSHVLREIEKHKMSKSPELRFKARQTSRILDDNRKDLHFDLKDYQFTLNEDYDKDYVDNKIIQCAVDNQYGLITNDLLLKIKAEAYKIDSFSAHEDVDKHYKGYKIVKLDDHELAYLYEHTDENVFGLLVNQYLWIKDINDEDKDMRKWDGQKLVELKLPKRNFIKPVNMLQRCAIDILLDTKVPIKIIAGTYGSGKTMLSVKSALYHLKDKGNYSKIMVVRQPVGSGREIGFLKGDKEDKTKDFYKPFIQHLEGGEQEAQIMEINGLLTKEIPFYMKGLSLESTCVVVDEAEDLTFKEIKLVGTRIEEDSCIIFAGDYNQAEDDYMFDNGLLQAIDRLKGKEKVGIIVLDKDERSEASKLFAEM